MLKSTAFGNVIAVEGSGILALIRPQHRAEAAAVTVNINASGRKIITSTEPAPPPAELSHIQLGSLVKVPTTDHSIAFGIITSLSLRSHISEPSLTDARIAAVTLIGEILKTTLSGEKKTFFQRGLSAYPALWAPVALADNEDLSHVYARPAEPSIRVGTLQQDTSIPAYILVDRMLATHFAILGTTGTGKSSTVALLLRQILNASPQGRIIIFDPHNEYSSAFEDLAEPLSPENFSLPYWLLNSTEAKALFIDANSPTYDREYSILSDAILFARIRYNNETLPTETITVDSPLPYAISDLLWRINDQMGSLEKTDGTAPYLRLLERINRFKNDPRFGFLFPGLVVNDTMDDICARLLRLPVQGRPMTIVDMSGVPAEVSGVVVSLLCRVIFDFAVWSVGLTSAPLLLVCEEAHRYMGEHSDPAFIPARNLLAQIAQEGRKYGLSLGIITQRPALLHPTILSQVNTLIAMRMSNEIDQAFIRKAIPESAIGLLSALSSLHRQEAIICGEGVTLPMRVHFSNLPIHQRPRSHELPFSERWGKDDWTMEKVQQVIWRWRLGIK
ncbi:MAG: ATP-binding protein [Holosporales bacterium]|jgi:DNA helicase HerA-like ATPase